MNVSKEILLFLIGILLEISVVSRSVTSDVKTKLIDINEFSPDKVYMKQTKLPPTWIAGAEDDELSSSSSSPEEEKKKGGKPLMWTRVKSLEQIRAQKILVYEAEKDIQFDKNLRVIRKELEHDRG